MKKIIKRIIPIILLIVTIIPLQIMITRADSGWGSSYSGGSSSSSSSSSYSSYSSHSSYSSSSSSYDGEASIEDIIISIVVIAIIFIVIAKFGGKGEGTSSSYKDISEDTLKEFLPNETLETLKQEIWDNFVDVQNAWMEFDYDKFEEIISEELYDSYVNDLEVLKLKKGKNVMSDFEKLDIKIIKVEKENGVITVESYLNAKFYDYVIDTTNNHITRGGNAYKINNRYILKHVVSELPKENITCPHCGADVSSVSSTTCPYCDSKLNKKPSKLVLSSKRNI